MAEIAPHKKPDPIFQAILSAYEAGKYSIDEIHEHVQRALPDTKIPRSVIAQARTSPKLKELFQEIVSQGSLEARLKVARLISAQAEQYLERIKEGEEAIEPKDFVKLAQVLKGPEVAVQTNLAQNFPFKPE